MDEMGLGGGCWKLASARKRPDLLSVIAAGQRPATSKVGTWSSQRSDRGHEVSTLMVAVGVDARCAGGSRARRSHFPARQSVFAGERMARPKCLLRLSAYTDEWRRRRCPS